MAIDDKFRYEKIQYGINKEAAKTSVLSSSKIDKYELWIMKHELINMNITGEEILPSDQSRII